MQNENNTRLALWGKLAEVIAAHGQSVSLMQPCADLARVEHTPLRQAVKACLADLKAEGAAIRAAGEMLKAGAGPLADAETRGLDEPINDLTEAAMLSIEYVSDLGRRPGTPAAIRQRARAAEESLSGLLTLAYDALPILWPDPEAADAARAEWSTPAAV